MKARKLPSGSWNVRIMINGQSYSFTHTDKKTALRMASDFADEYRRKMENPTLLERMREYVAENTERLSPSTIRAYWSIYKAIKERFPQLANKRIVSLTAADVQTIIKPLKTAKTQRNYVNLLQIATERTFTVRYLQWPAPSRTSAGWQA